MFGFFNSARTRENVVVFLQVLYMFCVKVIHRLSSLENKGRTGIFSGFIRLGIFAIQLGIFAIQLGIFAFMARDFCFYG